MAAYAGTLTDEQARDLAAFIDSQARPGFTPSGP
jgi:cytochrome c553